MNVLVAGGAGYIGSIVTRRLIQEGHKPVVLDNLNTGHAAASGDATFVQASMADLDTLRRTLEDHEIELVMHFAAHSVVGESVLDPQKYMQNNIVNTLNLLQLMLEVGTKKIVFSSSAAIYGTPVSTPITEEHPRAPINPYGFTKMVIEEAMKDYAEAYGLGYCALRYFNAAGAALDGSLGEDHRPESHLIPLILQVALGQRETIGIFGVDYPTPDGTCIRDYIHVEDLATAHILAMNKIVPGSGAVYNLGNGNGFSVREVIETARKITGHPIPTHDTPRRAGDPPTLVASAEQIQRDFGWEPKVPDIGGIIESAWTWHNSHPNGYDDA